MSKDSYHDIGSDIIDFLKTNYPTNESILIGCRTAKYRSYNCCEYDIVMLKSKYEHPSNNMERRSRILQFKDKKIKILFYNYENFIKNSNIFFLDYVNLTNFFFQSTFQYCFEKKKCYSKVNMKLILKRRLFKLALDIVQINKELLMGKIDQNLSSFYTKIISFQILELMIQLHLKEFPSPSHLKYQINIIRESNSKIKESINILLGILEIDQSNISSIERSAKSLFFLIKNGSLNNFHLDSLNTKLCYFKKRSMYVDGNLLIHSYIKNQNLDKNYIKKYNKILKLILNIKNNNEVSALKEMELIFNILKNLIEHSY